MTFSRTATIALAAAIGCTSIAASAQTGWNGTYRYAELLGRDAAGSGNASSVDHTLTIAPGTCKLDAEGFQSDEHIRCKATRSGAGRLQISFVSFADRKVANQYGVAVYKVGQPLLTLSTQGKRLVTTWQGYKLDNAAAKPGAYLTRSGTK